MQKLYNVNHETSKCMIQSSFIFLPRFGHKKEQDLWQQGITDWDRFLAASPKGIGCRSKPYYDRVIMKAKSALNKNDTHFFDSLLPSSDTWRLYTRFRDECAFLDIETSSYYGNITVIGIYDGERTKMMIRGFNLDRELFLKEIKKYKLLVTFNGKAFDVPVIKRYFHCDFKIPHVDLMHVCRKVNLTGGLKKIEKTLGIRRAKEVEEVNGLDAIYLWNMFKTTKERKYLDLLIKYNEEDIINLQRVADVSVNRLWESYRQLFH